MEYMQSTVDEGREECVAGEHSLPERPCCPSSARLWPEAASRMAFEFSVFGVLACLCLAASAGQWSVGVVLVSLIVVLLGIRAYVGVPPTMKGNKLPKRRLD